MAPGEKIPPPVSVAGSDNTDDVVLAQARAVHDKRTGAAAENVGSVEGDFSGMRARRGKKRRVEQDASDATPPAGDESTQTRPAPINAEEVVADNINQDHLAQQPSTPKSARAPRSQPGADKQPTTQKPPKAEKTTKPKPQEPAPRVLGGYGNLNSNPFGQPEQYPFGVPGEPLKFENSSLESLGLHTLPDHTHAEREYIIQEPEKKAEEAEATAEAVAEKGPWTGTLDTVLVALAGGNKEWYGQAYTEYKNSRRNYLNQLNKLASKAGGREVRSDKVTVQMREAYLEARNDLLISIASRMRPGAGFVLTEVEKKRDPNREGVPFTLADVLKVMNEADAGINDASFDGVAAMLREPDLVRAYGPTVSEDPEYTGEAKNLYDLILNPGTRGFEDAVDGELLNQFNDARLEALCAYVRNKQGVKDGRTKDWNRSFRKDFSLSFFERGREGYEDKHDRLLSNLMRAIKKGPFDKDTKMALKNRLDGVLNNEALFMNEIWKNRIEKQKRALVQPLTQALVRHPEKPRNWLLNLRDKYFPRPHDADSYEPSRPDGLELSDAFSREEEAPTPSTAERAQNVTFSVAPGDRGATNAFEDMIKLSPEVRSHLLSGLQIPTGAPKYEAEEAARRLFFFDRSGAPATFPEGTQFEFVRDPANPNEDGLYLRVGENGNVIRLTEANGVRTGYRSFNYER